MPFKGTLGLDFLRPTKEWEVTRPLTYVLKDGEEITVHKGFCTDGASIPVFFRRIIGSPFDAEYVEAAVIHDFLCVLSHHGKYSRPKADSVFSQIMAENKVFPIKRKAMWLGVRAAGIFRRIFIKK